MTTEGPGPLQDRQAEEAVLGSVMMDPEHLQRIDLQPDEFFIVRNRLIWQALQAMARAGQEIDYLTISNHLANMGKLEEIGGPAYIMGLINAMPTSLHAEAYAADVREMATRREILRAANELAKGAYDRTRPVDQTITEMMAKIPQLARVKSGARSVSYYARRHMDHLDELAKQPRGMVGIPTGFAQYDKMTGGARRKELLLIAGKPGKGKTMWMLTAGFQMGAAGYAGAIYEMETGEYAVMDREISRMKSIPSDHLETGSLTNEEYTSYCKAIEELGANEQYIFMSFDTAWTTASLRADLTRLKAEADIQWFMVDYLKFLRDRYGTSETERLNFISGELKRICNDLDLAGMVIHSMNKEGLRADIPDLESMSQGADIAFDCDKAMFIIDHSPKKGAVLPNGRTFIMQKSRSKISGENIFHMEKLLDFPAFRDLPEG